MWYYQTQYTLFHELPCFCKVCFISSSWVKITEHFLCFVLSAISVASHFLMFLPFVWKVCSHNKYVPLHTHDLTNFLRREQYFFFFNWTWTCSCAISVYITAQMFWFYGWLPCHVYISYKAKLEQEVILPNLQIILILTQFVW